MADNLGANPIPQQPNDFPRQAKKLVESIVTEGATEDYLKEAQANVVWFGYVLGNWKALVSTTIPDGRYYEVTYNFRGALHTVQMSAPPPGNTIIVNQRGEPRM